MAELTQLLQKSLAEYRELLLMYDEIPGLLQDAPPEGIAAFCKRLQKRQALATSTDARLNDLLQNSPPARLPEVFHERQDVLLRLQERNSLLSPKISGMMAVISSELKTIKDGKTAVSGYAGDGRGSGTRLHRTY